MGAPLNPPVSANLSVVLGRVFVVFVAIIPDIPISISVSIATLKAFKSISGENFTKTGVLSTSGRTAPKIRFKFSADCSSRNPGVFGELTFMVK